MRYLRVLSLLIAFLWSASNAPAQYGLYGAPGMLDLPPTQSEFSAQSAYPGPGYVGEPGRGDFAHPAYTAAKPVPLVPATPVPIAASELETRRENAPSVVDQILQESARHVSSSWESEASEEEASEAVSEYAPWQGYGLFGRAMREADCGDPCVPCCESTWYATGLGLIMSRDDANHVWVSYETGANENQLMHTDMSLDWRGGGEIRFGRRFCCGLWALEAAYWTLDEFSGFASMRHPSGVSTPLNFFDVVYADPTIIGNPVDLFDGAEEHRLWRSNEVQNVELNLIRSQIGFGSFAPFDFNWLVGARFFRFDEDLMFGSLRQGGLGFGLDPTLEGYLEDRVENNLIGVQVGCDVGYRRGNWRLFAAPRVGVYNNHIKHSFNAYRGDGELFDAFPAGYPSYPVRSSKDVISFLTEVDVGLEWQFATRWSAQIGYRVTLATAMALADHQIPPFVVDTPELADIDANGHLLLHGGFAGLTFNF